MHPKNNQFSALSHTVLSEKPRLSRSLYTTLTATVTAVLLTLPNLVSAQVCNCLPNSTGPIFGDPTPFAGGMCDLGTIGGDESTAYAVSADGRTVVGFINAGGGTLRRSTVWTPENGPQFLDTLITGTVPNPVVDSNGRARGVNGDGSIIVGNELINATTPRPVRWVNGVVEDLGTLNGFAGTESGNAFAVTPDGSTIVGWSVGLNQVGAVRARRTFRWVEGSTSGSPLNPQMQDIGTVTTDETERVWALNLSNDGTTVVGYYDFSTGDDRGYRWVEGANFGLAHNPEIQDLGTLRTDQGGFNQAWDVNSNGTIVAGYAENDAGLNRAYRWVEGAQNGFSANPEMFDLGTLRSDQNGQARAYGISSNGNVVVGFAQNDDGNFQAFRWLRNGSDGPAANPEMQSLGTLRTDQRGTSFAWGVSDDGSTVVGESDTDDGFRRAFIWRSVLQDLENLIKSFQPLANDGELAAANQQFAIGHLIDQTLLAEKETSRMRLGGWLANTADTRSDDIGEQTNAIGTLTYGRGLDGKTTLGATVSISATDLGRNNFDPSTGYGASLWAEYSETGLARSGWQAGAAIGWGQVSSEITRGRDLANVTEVEGEADLRTWGARATAGYGFQNETWLVTPSASIYYFDTKRDSYAESGADFLGRYDSFSVGRSMASLEISAERSVSEKGILELTLGLEHDFDEDRVTLNGQSDVPGQENFSIESNLDRRNTRAFVRSTYSYHLDENSILSAVFRVGQAAYGSHAQMIGGLRFEWKF